MKAGDGDGDRSSREVARSSSALTARPPRGTKAARNEGRKLAATFMNNIGVGFVLAGVLQPALAVARAAEAFGPRDILTTIAFGVLGVIFAALAQLISRRIED